MYESSPKVKCRECMFGASQLIAELKVPRRDHVSILPRSCVDFIRSAQAEIVCRFRQVIEWSSLEIGSDLENLHRAGELWERGDRGDGRK